MDEIFKDIRKSFPEVPVVTAEQLAAMKNDPALVLVDVREPEERRVSIIPGAISREEFEKTREAHKGAKVVTYCTIGHRSGVYAARLRSEGVEASNLAGSILAWTFEGGPLVDARGPTRRVHVFGAGYNLVADGYEAVW